MNARQREPAGLCWVYLPPDLRSAARSPQREPSPARSDELSHGPANKLAIGATN